MTRQTTIVVIGSLRVKIDILTFHIVTSGIYFVDISVIYRAVELKC